MCVTGVLLFRRSAEAGQWNDSFDRLSYSFRGGGDRGTTWTPPCSAFVRDELNIDLLKSVKRTVSAIDLPRE